MRTETSAGPLGSPSAYRGRMAEPEVFDWDEWENGKVYALSNDELVGALLSEVSALRKRVKLLEDGQPS
jgi:hypothetical protein